MNVYYIFGFTSLFSGLFIVNLIFSYQSKHIDATFLTTIKYQLLLIPVFLIANMLIGYGIKFGHKAIGNLTFVLISAKGLELFITLIMGYIFYREIPTWKTFLGLFIIVVGVMITRSR